MPNLPKKSFKPDYLPAPEKTRATGDQDFYNSWAWRKLAKVYRIDNPICENCKDKNRRVEAEMVDHTIPMPTGRALDKRNLMSLCHICHNSKSGQEGKVGGPLIAHIDGLPINRNDIFKLLK